MAQAARLNLRMQKELKLLLTDPPPGVSLPMLSDEPADLSLIHAQIQGPEGTVYANGIFSIKIQIPDRYPFQPPNVTFATPIYHPNIDNGGRICLDILNLPPKGAWQPSLNISTVLTSIGLLLSEPNPDDGLMCEASREYKYNRQTFDQKARSMTEKYAKFTINGNSSISGSTPCNPNSSQQMEAEVDGKSKSIDTDNGGIQKKLTRVSRKLSLESSGTTHGRISDVNTMAHSNKSLSHSQSLQMASCKSSPTPPVDIHGEQSPYLGNVDKLGNISTKSSLEPRCDIGHTFSLDFSGPSHGTNSVDKEVLVQSHSLLLHSKSLSVTSSKSIPTVVGNLVDKQLHRDCEENGNTSHKKLSDIDHHLSIRSSCLLQQNGADKGKSTFSNSSLLPQDCNYDGQQPHLVDNEEADNSPLKTINKKLCRMRDVFNEIGNDDNKENVPPNYQLTPKNHIKSTNSLGMPQEGNYDGQQLRSDHDLGVGNGGMISSHKKFGGLSRKLSLGLASSSKSRDNAGMANVLPILKSLPHSQSPHLVLSKSSPVPHDGTHEQQPYRDYDGKPTNGNIEKEVSLITEAVIVLDSEDSEEEAKVPIRSRLSISRKRLAGKRKVNA